ncbi:MAG: hypothetical protein JW889_06765 [Verrucomicrobia bacterium]|nr:hypothetical protein [Verrucomicrobiota bacterium]
MGWFEMDIDAQHKAELEAAVEKRLAERQGKGEDPEADEQRCIGDLLDYAKRGFEDISYDLYNARKFVRMFPDEAEGASGILARLKRFYRRVVRRVLRQQIVYNEAVLGVLEDLERRVRKLEAGARDEKETGSN